MLGDDLEKVDRLRPMLGVFLWREIFESRKIDLLALDEVHQVAEIGGKV